MAMLCRAKSRTGFDRMDLLVMSATTLIQVVILLPAVQKARLEAQKTACINHQRGLALAMRHYDALYGRLPGWTEPMVPWEQTKTPVPVGWVFPLLPHLERDALHRRATTAGGPLYNTPPRKWPKADRLDLGLLLCPADSKAARGPLGQSYVANGGYRDRAAEKLGPYAGGEPSFDGPEQDGPASAVFLNRYPKRDLSPLPSQSLAWIHKKDGAAQTLMFSENLHAGRWDLLAEDSPASIPREGSVTFNFANSLDSGPNNLLRVNAARESKSPPHERGSLPGPNSFHLGGANAAYCDGHVEFISQEIDWAAWTLLFTPDGRNLHTTWPDGVGEVNVFAKLIGVESF